MKRYFLIPLLCFCCVHLYGQSITLLNLINLTNLTNTEAGQTLTAGKTFQLQFGEQVDGFVVEHYQTLAPANKLETVIIGTGFKTSSGAVLHTVSYVTGNTQNVVNLVGQSKGSGLSLTFTGSDAEDNIYIYDSALYHVIFRINFNQTKGVIDISQKQIFVE
jgi:hypothetical protein